MEPELGPGWWQRNWRWFVPVGCIALALLAASAVALVLSLVDAGIKSSDAYREAFARAREDCALQEALGAPISAGWLPSGSIEVTGPSGSAELAIPLRGARRRATLYVSGTKAAGRWSFATLEVEVPDREARIDLTDAARPRCK